MAGTLVSVFDAHNLPHELEEFISDEVPNDSFVQAYINDEDCEPEEPEQAKIAKWLRERGACRDGKPFPYALFSVSW